MTRSEAGKIGASVSTPRLQAQARKRYYENPNYCKQCGSIIHPEEGAPRACSRAREKNFCNKTCSTKYNNLHRQRKPWSEEAKQRFSDLMKLRHPNADPKRKRRKKGQPVLESNGACERCGQTVEYREMNRKDRRGAYYLKRYYCDDCLPIIRSEHTRKHHIKNGCGFSKPLEEMTKAELRNEVTNPLLVRVHIVSHSRKTYEKSGLPKICKICGYSKAVDVCHKRPVSDFPDDTPVKDINHIDNLTCLCKNHHWELDHDLLDEGVVL